MKPSALLLLAAAVYAGAAPAADLGRLFYTPAQRTLLDGARRQNVSIEVGKDETTEAAAAPQTLSVNGMVRRSDGKTTVWVNGRPISDQASAGLTVSGGTVRIAVPDSGRIVDLKVGQTADVVNGSVREGYVRPEPSAGAAPATNGTTPAP